MPKERTNRRALTRSWVQDVFTMDCRIVFCKCCQRQNHMIHPEARTIYQRNVLTNGPDTFDMELCQAMVDANIPWYKLQSPRFKTFLEKHCSRSVPPDSVFTKECLHQCYEDTLTKIRSEIGNNCIWIALNECTDVKGRYIANITLGKLSADESSTPHLLAIKIFDKIDHGILTRFVNDELDKLWPNGVKYDRVLLLYTNSEEYMIKTGTSLRNFYPNLIHVTCLAQTLNSVCELIRAEYIFVTELISNVKKLFLEAPIRILKFRNNFPNLPLPPQAALAKWSSWLKAALYYQKNFEAVKQVVMKFDPEASEIVNVAQKCFKNKEIKNNLIYIGSNFKTLSKMMRELERSENSLVDAVALIQNVRKSLYKAPGRVAQKTFRKLDNQLKSNSGFNILRTIADILCGKNGPELPENISCETAVLLKYAPVMCCDVERCFPNFRTLLTDKRLMALTYEEIEKIVVLYSNVKCEADSTATSSKTAS